MTIIAKIAVFACLFLAPSLASACIGLPQYLFTHHTELIARKQSIILATVTGPSEKTAKFWGGTKPAAQFQVVEILKGAADEKFTLTNGSFSTKSIPTYFRETSTDFYGHRSSGFWMRDSARSGPYTDCQIHPLFEAGRTYLLFTGGKHIRAYEEIKSPDDLWLQAVRAVIANPDLKSGLSITVPDWLKLAKSVFTARTDSCDGHHLVVEDVLRGPARTTWQLANKGEVSETCKIGDRFLVQVYIEADAGDDNHHASRYQIVDDKITFHDERRTYDVEFIGPTTFNVDALSQAFR